MRYVQLRLELPVEARHPMHRFLTERDHIDRSYLRHWNFSDPKRVTCLFRVVGDVRRGADAYIAALNDVDTIVEHDVTIVDENTLYVYLNEEANQHARQFRSLLAGTDLLVVPPIEYGSHGEMLFEVAGVDDELQALLEDLPSRISVSVDRLGEYNTSQRPLATVLTDRQRNVLAAAQELGYYEIPRKAGIREVAEAVGCAKSTAANHLRKAESRIIRTYGRTGRCTGSVERV